MSNKAQLDRRLVLELVRVTELAAIAASKWVGKGEKESADAAAVEAMRRGFDDMAIDGRVVIGEGERDEAPMLYIGEEVGKGGDAIDIALDPLEGTTITANGQNNALAVVAIARRGDLLNAPDTYMEKIAVGPGYPDGIIDLDKSAAENAKAIAKAKGVKPSEIVACVLDRPRHDQIIKDLRDLGCSIRLIGDGDVAGVMSCATPNSDIDFYMGTGGAPEGVLASAALKCLGGQFQGRLVFRNEDEKARAAKWGITDLHRIYSRDDMVKGDVIFAATGVTDGNFVEGVKKGTFGQYRTETLVLRAATGTIRTIQTEHMAKG